MEDTVKWEIVDFCYLFVWLIEGNKITFIKKIFLFYDTSFFFRIYEIEM